MNEREQERLRALAEREGETEEGRILRRWLDEWSNWRELIILGEAAGGLVHALNNHLNSMMLQAACVELKAGVAVREAVEAIRQEGARASARLRPVQSIRPWQAESREQVDLAEVVKAALPAGVEVERAGEPAAVQASRRALERIVWLLGRLGLEVAERPVIQVGPGAHLELRTGIDLGEEGPMPDSAEGYLRREALSWLVRQVDARMLVQGQVLVVTWQPDEFTAP